MGAARQDPRPSLITEMRGTVSGTGEELGGSYIWQGSKKRRRDRWTAGSSPFPAALALPHRADELERNMKSGVVTR